MLTLQPFQSGEKTSFGTCGKGNLGGRVKDGPCVALLHSTGQWSIRAKMSEVMFLACTLVRDHHARIPAQLLWRNGNWTGNVVRRTKLFLRNISLSYCGASALASVRVCAPEDYRLFFSYPYFFSVSLIYFRYSSCPLLSGVYLLLQLLVCLMFPL